jgi:hypothetical protein
MGFPPVLTAQMIAAHINAWSATAGLCSISRASRDARRTSTKPTIRMMAEVAQEAGVIEMDVSPDQKNYNSHSAAAIRAWPFSRIVILPLKISRFSSKRAAARARSPARQ